MRIALGIEYDGSGFSGWQTQEEVRTVQASVEAALSKVASQDIRVKCAGRTDTGVHAVEQVVHFDTHAERSARSWVLGGNSHLPDDVRILWAKPVDEEFDARFSALSRHYRYVILNRWVKSSLLRKRVTWEHRELNASVMHEAGQFLVGRHDFSSFRALACQAKSPVREIYSLIVGRTGEFVYIDVHANAFLHHMVRNIAGVLIAVGKGDQPIDWPRQILQLKNRRKGGVTAPADGLYLTRVQYPERFSLPQVGAEIFNLPAWKCE